jgi:hypothetical protein
MVLNGTIGARLHIPFPILNRSSFGFWFSYFSVVSRVVLSLFWFGILVFCSLCPSVVETNNASDFQRVRMHVPDVESHLAIYSSCSEPSIGVLAHHLGRFVHS